MSVLLVTPRPLIYTHSSYLDMFNHHYAIFDTPTVQEDEAAWRAQLVHVVRYVLAIKPMILFFPGAVHPDGAV